MKRLRELLEAALYKFLFKPYDSMLRFAPALGRGVTSTATLRLWAPLPVIPGRQMELLGEIYHRRFDQFSHILRVYRVLPPERS